MKEGAFMTALFEQVITDENNHNKKLLDWQIKRLADLSDPAVSEKREFKEAIKVKFMRIGLIDENGKLTPQYGGEETQ